MIDEKAGPSQAAWTKLLMDQTYRELNSKDGRYFSDATMNVFQDLLSSSYELPSKGIELKTTQITNAAHAFPVVENETPMVVFVPGHWFCAFLTPRPQQVTIFDSLVPGTTRACTNVGTGGVLRRSMPNDNLAVARTREKVHHFFPHEGLRAGRRISDVKYEVRRAQQQGFGTNDCGPFTLAYLTLWCELVFNTSGSLRKNVFDMMEEVVFQTDNFAMRRHLLKCLKAKKMTPFPTRGITLVPTMFTRRGQDGDFNWMIRQPQYRSHFFIYNDNEEAMLSQSSRAGGGNAIIRPFRAASPPKAWGIPTGSRGQGYASLNDTTRSHIDAAIDRIVSLCREHGYTHVHYSANRDGSLGTAIFVPHLSVTAYILRRLQESFPSK